ncbi:hypothetical protein GBAR_LOCUS13159 [Geodia barretti]|uniref:Uncharacterized protein n=1 Tax=Geodia barretti TaxID=519541 RepID=A0AA35S346_GEOBA|nr:hypothetical protein GBAR_LOCUS13159 [Geodia barretti]
MAASAAVSASLSELELTACPTSAELVGRSGLAHTANVVEVAIPEPSALPKVHTTFS